MVGIYTDEESLVTELEQETCRVTRLIPPGSVLTYKALAHKVGSSPQTVGNVMAAHKDDKDFPWWRVVANDGDFGMVSKNAPDDQRERLQQEGVVFKGKRIDLQRFGWSKAQV